MNTETEKHLDLDLLIFYLIVSLITSGIFLWHHPIILILRQRDINFSVLFEAYSVDLFLFLLILVPYLFIIIFLMALKLKTGCKISDNIMVVLFFPLLSFFTKGMSLLHVYVKINLIEILKENFAFFSFLFIGPLIIITHKAVINLMNSGIIRQVQK